MVVSRKSTCAVELRAELFFFFFNTTLFFLERTTVRIFSKMKSELSLQGKQLMVSVALAVIKFELLIEN